MPESERFTTGYLIWRVTMKWRAAVERAVTPLGLTHAQYTLLASLRALSGEGAQPSQRELADYTGLEQVYVSKLARALDGAGFIERATHQADPRAVQLRLTERGAEVVARAVPVVLNLLEELTAPIGGTAGRRNRELINTLRTLLGQPRPSEGEGDMTQATTPLFGQVLGVAHRAASRVAVEVIAREGFTFPEWIIMKMAHDEGAAIPRDTLIARVAGGLDADPADIEKVVGELESRRILGQPPEGLTLTEEGRAQFDRLFAAVQAVSAQLLAGLSTEDIANARRVLAGFTERANELLAP